MENDYQKMYNNLSVLLQDICQFLSNDKLGSLSHRDKKLVESLIMRSKVQLQEIAKISNNSVMEEYVDMDAKKDDINKNEETTIQTIPQEEAVCPFDDLPAREASQVVKYGFINMKRKFLLGFEKMKRVYGAIHHKWLLIYYTEKDMKPICTFNLKNYEAKESDGSKSTNFELISTLDRKVYYFMALTPKDMLQWVVNINRSHDRVVVESKELDLENDDISLEEDIGEHYDAVIPVSENHNDNDEDEDDIYLELDDIMKPHQNNNTMSQKYKKYDPDVGPPLPTRPQKEDIISVSPLLIKPSTSSHGSEESLASYDDIKDLVKLPDQNSDEDEDTMYEAFVNVKQKINKMSNPLPPENKVEVNESTDISETEEIVTIKYDVTETKYDTVVSIKDKFERYQSYSITKSDTNTDAEKTPTRSYNRSPNLLFQELIKKTNTPPNLSPDVEPTNEVNTTNNKNSEPTTPNSKNVKGAFGLNPPVIKKVPAVPLKPKVRDKPSIGKRHPFSSFRQVNDDQ